MKNHEESLRLFEKFLEETPKEKIDAIIAEIDGGTQEEIVNEVLNVSMNMGEPERTIYLLENFYITRRKEKQ